MLTKFLADESGATAVEQALLTAFVALALIAVASLAGRTLFDLFLRVASEITGDGDSGRIP